MAWILRLVKAGADGSGQVTDVMEIAKPDDLADIGNLGLSLAEAKACWQPSSTRWSPPRTGTKPCSDRIADHAAAPAT